nr:hypothetical protein [Microbacterium hydrocarbonoxydans]
MLLAIAGWAIAGIAALGVGDPAAAAPTTDVVQGQVLRLVSVADWGAASSLRPGQRVRWDVTVSADAPDPGTVRIGISARGDADLLVDAHVCMRAWEGAECPGGARALRLEWPLPRDGVEVPLVEMAEDDVAHLRLSIALDGPEQGSTDVRVHAQGAGESAAIGPDGGLAATGPPADVRWVIVVGGVLLVAGTASALLRRRTDPPGAPGMDS